MSYSTSGRRSGRKADLRTGRPAGTDRSAETGRQAGTGAGTGSLGTLGRACYRHRWITLLTWMVGVACLITLWVGFGAPADDSFGGSDPGQAMLNAHFHRQSGDTLTLAIQ